MNISLPDTLKTFVDEQVAGRGYGTSSEYVRELIRKDQDRQRLRRLLLDGAESTPGAAADALATPPWWSLAPSFSSARWLPFDTFLTQSQFPQAVTLGGAIISTRSTPCRSG